jgi:outer membrane biosynthesis protein TonB
MYSFVRVGRRRGAAPEEATAAAPAPVFNFAAPVVAAPPAAPEAEKEEKKEKEKEETTQAAEQPEKEEKKEEKEKEKEEKKEEQKPSDEDKKETTKVDFGKTPENVRSPARALSLPQALGANRVHVLLCPQITVAQFSFGLPATSSSPTTGGFVFGASSSTTTDSTVLW